MADSKFSKQDDVCILLAAFNGERYIGEQICSIQSQTLQNWNLLVRDDGSTDRTREVVSRIAESDNRITLLHEDSERNQGPAKNFGKLLEVGLKTNSAIFFLCDQDDVWESTKLERQVQEFSDYGKEPYPLLVHSDLAVVDERLEPIHASFISYMALSATPKQPLNYLLTRNFVTGCAAAINRRLLEQAVPCPDNIIMHDWWLALAAASTGKIRFIDRPLLKYRQHTSNVIGAVGFWHLLSPARNWLFLWRAGDREFLATFKQARAMELHAKNTACWAQVDISVVARYSQLLQLPLPSRVSEARRLGLREGSALLQLVFLLRLTIFGPEKPSTAR